ncbi:hypothetical protein PHMEG_00029075 [Phytophthora megakarya]|uniref:Uncharacterized protein n=1 Tax=Phytophthora megakarya TaxID=4795 RepID=A0A225V3F3_9STRA|nr:hypothetical protein PHMEG_00029075 [Phytophthora megakarya]
MCLENPYERYMTDLSTNKLWSAIKLEMSAGGYIGYVANFRKLNRIVQVDSLTAMNLFLNGISDSIMKQKFLRKRPSDLNAAIQKDFWSGSLKTNIRLSRGWLGETSRKILKCENKDGKKIFTMLERMVVGENQTSDKSQRLNE